LNNKNNEKKSNTGFLSTFVKNSIILSALERFTLYIYSLLKNGFFGLIFGKYNDNMKSHIYDRFSTGKVFRHYIEFRYGICRRIESSVIINFFKSLSSIFLACRLKVFGTFLSTFGLYTAIMTVIISFINGNFQTIINHPNIAVSIIMLLSSVPLILSKKNLAEALFSSRTGHLIINITGFSTVKFKNMSQSAGRMNLAFLFGIISGALTYYVSPIYIICAIILTIWLYIVLVKPEFGVLTLFFAVPFLPTMVLAVMVIFVSCSYFIKLFRGKRVFRVEPIDILAIAFILLTFCGGTISQSSTSLKPALLMVCLMLGYFLTVGLIRERKWLVKCSVALVISGAIESLYAIILYFFGGGYTSDAWLDSEMFSTIGGRAVGSLDNPNMLAEFLILIIPIAVSMFIGRGEGLGRFQTLLSLGIMGVALVITWSRGAWLAIIIAALIYLLMWHHRSIWIILGGVAALPVIMTVLPNSIISRFASIGNLSDSSTSYRVYIWRAVVNMISDNPWSGIGIGEGAWRRVYPLYSYIGIEAAPHSHDLYLQIWLELGIIGLVVFALFLFMLYQSGLTLFSKLSNKISLTNADISEDIMHQNLSFGNDCISKITFEGKKQLRISTIGPMCGILAFLAQGITDYSWYNYRLFLAFWLVCGLASAYIRNGSRQISDIFYQKPDTEKATIEINVSEMKR